MERPTREINEYVDLNESQVAGIQRAARSIAARGSHERIKEWVSSWNRKKGRPAPKR